MDGGSEIRWSRNTLENLVPYIIIEKIDSN